MRLILRTEYGANTAFLFAVGPMVAPTSNAVVNMKLLVNELKTLGFNAHSYVYSFTVSGHPIASEHQTMAQELYNFITSSGIITGNSLPETFDNESVKSEEYFTLTGLRIKQPVMRGVYIKKNAYGNGKVEINKVYWKE